MSKDRHWSGQATSFKSFNSPKWFNIDAQKIYPDDKIPELERHINYNFAGFFLLRVHIVKSCK